TAQQNLRTGPEKVGTALAAASYDGKTPTKDDARRVDCHGPALRHRREPIQQLHHGSAAAGGARSARAGGGVFGGGRSCARARLFWLSACFKEARRHGRL